MASRKWTIEEDEVVKENTSKRDSRTTGDRKNSRRG